MMTYPHRESLYRPKNTFSEKTQKTCQKEMEDLGYASYLHALWRSDYLQTKEHQYWLGDLLRAFAVRHGEESKCK